MQLADIFETFQPSSRENLEHQLAYLQANLESSQDLLVQNVLLLRSDLDDEDSKLAKENIQELRDEIADFEKQIEDVTAQLGQLGESADPKEALKKQLAKAKADLADMPQNPGNQAGYDALDDQRAKIKKLEAQLK